MTARDKTARRKLELLEVAADLSNVSRAYKVVAHSHQQFCGLPHLVPHYRRDAGRLDDYLVGYNQPRPHRGRRMNARRPATAFEEGLPKYGQRGKRPEKRIAQKVT